jgi:hypothetical protein
MSNNIKSINQLCNAPSWKYKTPTIFPPKLSLNYYFQKSNKHFELENRQPNVIVPVNMNNCSLSTNSESDDEYQVNISILSLLEKTTMKN